MRVTNQDLEITLRNINAMSKRKYAFDSAYGGVKLVDDKTNTEITPRRLTKKEMDAVLTGIERYLQQEKKA